MNMNATTLQNIVNEYSRLVSLTDSEFDTKANLLISQYFDALNKISDCKKCFEFIYWDDLSFQSALLYLVW